jgi:hypothetical protein
MNDLFDFDIDPNELLEEEVIEDADVEEEDIEDEVIEDEPEVDDEDITPAKIFYDFAVENGIISSDTQFDGNIDTIKKELENLPIRSFETAVSSLPEFAQAVVNYVFSKDINSVDDFTEFINNTIKPAYEGNEFNEDSARDYLREKYETMGVYANDDDLEETLDLLEEKGTLVKTAKALADKDNIALKQTLNKQIEEDKKAKIEEQRKQQEYAEQFGKSINTTLSELPWADTRKREVLNNLKPDILNKKNDLIRQSPKAIVQLADIYSYFDESKGEFDFSKLIDAKAESKANSRTKDNYQKDKFSSAIAGLGKQLPNRKEKSIIEVVDFDYTE